MVSLPKPSEKFEELLTRHVCLEVKNMTALGATQPFLNMHLWSLFAKQFASDINFISLNL